MTIPTPVAGTITIVFLVALGIFIYPLLLKRRAGFVILAAVTVALAALFYAFDSGRGAQPSVVLAIVWALLPVATGVLVWRLQHKRTPNADEG